MRNKLIASLSALLLGPSAALARRSRSPLDNFKRAESDLYMAKTVHEGGLGKFHHSREPTPIDKQTVSG